MIFDRKPYESRFTDVWAELQRWLPAFKELVKYVLPTHGRFDGEQPNQGKKIDHTEVLDGAPGRAVRTSAIGFSAHLTSPAQPWLALTVGDKDLARLPNVKWWTGVAVERMLSVFADSNTYEYFNQLFEEFLGFNNCAGYTEEDRQSTIRSQAFTIGEYALGVGADGRIDTFARAYSVTVKQIVERFGIDNVTPQTARLHKERKLDENIKCRHIIMPNLDRKEGRADNKNMPFISLYWEEAAPDNMVLSHSGYNEFPIQAGRWKVISSDTYAKGCSWEALGDCKELQKLKREYLIALEKVNDPPTQGPEDTEIDTVPGGFTPTSDERQDGGVKATYQIRPDVAAMLNAIEAKKKDINEAFFADRFLTLGSISRGMTMREVYERLMEDMRAVGPVVVKVQTEIIDPFVRRVFYIMLRAGLFPPVPPELVNQSLNIEYISLMAQAQKASRTQPLQEHLLFVGQLAQSDPSAWDNVDKDKAIRLNGEMLSVQHGVDRAPEEVVALREDRAKAEQAAAQAQQLEKAAAMAGTLSKADLGGDNALSRLVGPKPQGAA